LLFAEAAFKYSTEQNLQHHVSDLTRKTKSSQGSSKTRRISIKESLDKAPVQLGSDGDEVNKYYSSSSGEYVVDCSKLNNLNNERQTSKRRLSKEWHDKSPGRFKSLEAKSNTASPHLGKKT
jgi:hypothetical protein